MKLVCFRNDIDSFLEIGKTYTLEFAEIGSWKTYLKLRGFKEKVNSVQFKYNNEELNILDIPDDLKVSKYERQ